MSFTTDVCEELLAFQTDKKCCKKAMLCGLLWGCKIEENGGKKLTALFKTAHGAEQAVFLIESRYGAFADIEEIAKVGRKYWRISTDCLPLLDLFSKIDAYCGDKIWEIMGFKCSSCRASFLRGAFISLATVNDPQKSYRLEFAVSDTKRANQLEGLLSLTFGAPKRINREKNVGLYYKANSTIAGIINYIGAAKTSFLVATMWVERDIRNNANRVTNCEAQNIARAVSASQKHIEAIEKLRESGKIFLLSEELQITARLRIEYDSVSLSELASLHQPPISKSGLNQRLRKILAAADELVK